MLELQSPLDMEHHNPENLQKFNNEKNIKFNKNLYKVKPHPREVPHTCGQDLPLYYSDKACHLHNIKHSLNAPKNALKTFFRNQNQNGTKCLKA